MWNIIYLYLIIISNNFRTLKEDEVQESNILNEGDNINSDLKNETDLVEGIFTF